ncbi:MAG: hypothetical protein A4E57_00687 [Syntrophorhabdaceae bacterium PtaU1.Bin034]|nr:MAG: hypothetical protein A4E57_00687 [Syntrophorhabdaceae bacterium PtaU1.Bin034]
MWYRSPAVILALLLVSVLGAGPARADDFRLLPSITEELQYNDNVLISPTDRLSDFLSVTTGGLQLTDKTERMNLDVSAGATWNAYRRNTTFDSRGYRGSAQIGYLLNPRLQVSGQFSYMDDSQPDQELQTTGLVLDGVRRTNITADASAVYNFSEKTAGSLLYGHGAVRYDSQRFSDLNYDTATFGLTHDLSRFLRNTKATFNAAYARYSTADLDVENYEARVGLNHALHEKWSISVNGGVRRTDSTFDQVTLLGFAPVFVDGFFGFVPVFGRERESRVSWGGVGEVALSYQGELTDGTFAASQDIEPASGRGGTVERTAFTFSLGRQLSYEFRSRLAVEYFINSSKGNEFATIPTNTRTLNIRPSVRYDFNRDMFVEGSYTFTKLDDREAGQTAYRNLFMVRFFLQHPFLE